MESEVNDALEQTINNFKEMRKTSSNEILFQRVLERLIIDEILLQKAKNLE